MVNKGFFETLEDKFDITRNEFLLFIIALVLYYVFLKYQQQWIITSMTIDIYNEGAT